MNPEPAAKSPSPSQPIVRYIPILLLLLAFALRLYGITWSLPDQTHAYSYHVDESVVVGHSLDLDPLAGKLDPNFYNYGSLTLLLNGFLIHTGRAIGIVVANPPEMRPGGLALATGSELLTARLLSALLGTATVGFLFGTGRLLYGRAAGTVAGLCYAVAPLAVQHAHFATVDVGGVFWIAGSLYFAARHLTGNVLNRFAPGNLIVSGMFAGLAAAAKYNGGLVLLSGIVAWWLASGRRPVSLIFLIVATAFGFVLGCPGVVLNPAGVLRDVKFEANHVATGHGEVFVDTLPGFIYHVVFNLRWGLTLPLLLLCIIGVGIAIVRRRPGDAILAAFALPYYLLIGLAAVKFARYTLPLFPPLFLLVGAGWDGWMNVRARTGFRGFAICAGFAGLTFAVALDQTMMLPDTRDQAAAFIRSQTQLKSIGFSAGPWYYSPNLNLLLNHPYPPMAQSAASDEEGPPILVASRAVITDTTDGQRKMLPVEWYTPLIEGPDAPDAITFGEMHYEDWLRTRYKQALTYLQVANDRYPTHRNFTKPISLFGVPIVRIYEAPGEPWYGLPTQTLPHDMLYTNPSVSVWTR